MAMASTSSKSDGVAELDIDYDQLGVEKKQFKKHVQEMVLAFIAADQKKNIIKRADVLAACGLKGGKHALQEYVFAVAKSKLLQVFGIEIVNVPDKKNVYILTNKLRHANKKIKENEESVGRLGILFSVLSLIFMSNGKVTDTVLFKFLDSLGLKSDPEIEAMYEGDLEKYVNNVWVQREHYLRKDRIPANDNSEEQMIYSWGFRAEVEVDKEDVLKFVSEVYDCQPSSFVEQYNKIKQEKEAES